MDSARVCLFSVVMLLGTILVPQAAIGFLPVIDIHSILKLNAEISAVRKNYQELVALRKAAKDQLQAVKHNLSGLTHYGDLENEMDALSKRYASVDDPTAEASQPNAVYAKQEQVVRQQQAHGEINPRKSKQLLTGWRAANAAASQSQQDIQRYHDRQQTLQHLTQSINHSATAKSSADLNARLLGELGYLQNQQLQHAALLNQQLAAQKARQLSNEMAESDFTQVPQ